MDAVGDELLALGQYLDMGLGAVRHGEGAGVELRERSIGAVAEQYLRRPADADEWCGSGGLLDVKYHAIGD